MKTFEFELDPDGELLSFDSEDVTENEGEKILKSLVGQGLIEIGEKTEGTITIDKKNITVNHRVCVELGDDWDTDVWEDKEEFTIPNNV